MLAGAPPLKMPQNSPPTCASGTAVHHPAGYRVGYKKEAVHDGCAVTFEVQAECVLVFRAVELPE
jgi:hypothetical protein